MKCIDLGFVMKSGEDLVEVRRFHGARGVQYCENRRSFEFFRSVWTELKALDGSLFEI